MADERKPAQETPAGKETPIPEKRGVMRSLKEFAKNSIVRATSTKR